MNFLKISGLVIGTGSVVSGTGAGIYYVVIKNSEKVQFIGKLVFFKTIEGNDTFYQIKLLNEVEYVNEEKSFNLDKSTGSKYVDVNKIVEISHLLNIEKTKVKLNTIFGTKPTLEIIKSKILSESSSLKDLFNDEIYKKLTTIN